MKRIVIIGILFFMGWSIGLAQSSAWDDNSGFPSVFSRNAEAVADGGGPENVDCNINPCHPSCCLIQPCCPEGPVGDGVDVLLVLGATAILVSAVQRRRNKLRIIS